MSANCDPVRSGMSFAAPVPPRVAEMAEAIREVFYRDGDVTEPALIGGGFTATEIVEHFPEAQRLAHAAMVADGAPADRLPQIIEKAIAATAWTMPLTAGDADSETKRTAWRSHCTAVAAFKLDPRPVRRDRCSLKLKVFLELLVLIPSEVNRVLVAVNATTLRKERML